MNGSVGFIQEVVAARLGTTTLIMRSFQRTRRVVDARWWAMWVARRLTSHSYAHIGRCFGNRDHSSVIHAVRRVDEKIATDDRAAQLAAELVVAVRQQADRETGRGSHQA